MTRRTAYAMVAIVLAAVGIASVGMGWLTATSFGREGKIQSQSTRLVGSGAAIVGDGIQADESDVVLPSGLGTLTLDVAPIGGGAIFVGTARPSDVDTYLTGVPYNVVTKLAPGGTAKTRPVPGRVLPQNPQGQAFWVASSSGQPGQTVRLNADLGSGNSLVVTNVNPALGVDVKMAVTLSVPWAWPAAMVMLGGGAVLLLLAILLAWRSRVAGNRTRRERNGHRSPGSVVLPVSGTTVLPGTPANSGVVASSPPPAPSSRSPSTLPPPSSSPDNSAPSA
jgi:hypothetical protein